VQSGDARQRTALIVAISFAIVGVAAILYWGAPNQKLLNQEIAPPEEQKNLHSADPKIEALVLKYARAVQTADCDTVIAMTWWMQERLDNGRHADPPESDRDMRRDLCKSIQREDPEGNVLKATGIEDQFLFLPGSEFKVAGADGGESGLAKPVKQRVWLRVTYPNVGAAPKDPSGTYIRTLLAAVSVSTDGYILKAGVRGNAEIDLDSVEY
jgi:hypothetical protein